MKRKSIASLKEAGEAAYRYVTRDIFSIDTGKMSWFKANRIHALKVISLTIRKFMMDQCSLRASALTFYTLLSIVPVVALAFGIAKGFGLEERLEQDLYLRFSGQQEVINFIINFARTLLENTKGGLVAGIGVLTLLLSIVKVLNHIENAFNTIWGVKSRSFDRKFSDYLAIMMTGPILFTMASSSTVFIRTQVENFTTNITMLYMVSPLIFLALKLLPFLLVWIMFTIIYIIMPNTRVPLGSAVFAGIAAGTFYQLIQIVYITFQISVASYNAVYGSFAALPLFLVWLHISWLILLFGAEISSSHFIAERSGFINAAGRISFLHQKAAALLIVHYLVKRFEKGLAPVTVTDIAHELGLSAGLIHGITIILEKNGLISFTIPEKRNLPGLQPARDIHTLSIHSVISALDQGGDAVFQRPATHFHKKIFQLLDILARENQNSKSNHLIKDL